MSKPDIHVMFDGSKLYLLKSLTQAGDAWVEEHLDPAHLCWGRSIVVEDRFIEPILDGMQTDGLRVEVDCV